MESHSAPRPHHHGNLKESLIDYALHAARAGAVEALSLRKASRELGVSPGAVYRHFVDKDALMRALAQRGFDLLAQDFEAVMPYGSDARDVADAKARFVALAGSYVNFAQRHYGLWRLMFGPYGVAPPQPDKRASTYDWLQKSLIEMAEFKVIARTGHAAEIFAWTAIHGLSDIQASPAVNSASRNDRVVSQCDLIIAALQANEH